MPSFENIRSEYISDWSKISVIKAASADSAAKRIVSYRRRYEAVSMATGVPWYVIGMIHLREADLDFTTHLHNGDPLSARTHHVPANRPVNGNPPFAWEESAIDAIRYDGLDKIEEWPIERIAFACEKYNGFGPRNHGMKSGYLWAGSNIYNGGKYIRDYDWSPSTWDSQLGVMTVLKRMIDLGAVDLGSKAPSAVKTAPAATVTIAVVASAGAAAHASGFPWPSIVIGAVVIAAIAAVVVGFMRSKS